MYKGGIVITALKFMIALGILGHGINMYCDRILSIFPKKARDIMLDLMDSGAVLRTCFVAYVAYLITLIVAIVTGVIGFPIWAVVFTVLPLFILLYPFQIIGTVHLSAMISMFVWLLLI